ncbi:MAG TPA: hypothetical protein VNZ27_01595 [Rhodanobacter sp.]|jgi:hypothetical protein|nr:hypothetical protein [Rhodanobacter sp.]
MRNRDIERQIRDTAERAGERARHYADGAASTAQSLLERGRRRINERFGRSSKQYSQQLTQAAEDFADEANYHYRRVRRQVSRHPVATAAIVAGTIGAFLLLRRAFRSDNE